MADEHRKIVIVGGGAIGLSIAYHLGQLGFRDVLLLERHQLTSGTSWHAAGIVGPLRASMNLTTLAKYALELFERLEDETGQATGYQQTGGVWLAQRPERMIELKRIKAMGDRSGLQTSILSNAEIAERIPLLDTDDLAGGLWVDQDGQVNPVDLCMAYAKGARSLGVEIREQIRVDDIEVSNGRVAAVVLDDGSRIECDQLLLAAGAWTRQLAQKADIDLPLVACEHMYVVTDVIDKLPQPCPIIRDLDAGIYLKGDAGKMVLGAFEANPKPWTPAPQDDPFLMFDEDWDHVQPMLEAGIHRAPIIADQGITHFMNGPECFTPDTRQIMGESPQCGNLFIAAGFNSIGIMSSAGVGKVMAEWIRDGQAPIDLWEVDIARIDPLQAADDFLRQRISESVHNQFDMHWPYKQYKTGRAIRISPWHQQLANRAAVFGAPTGWERPLYYATDAAETELKYSYGVQNWWPCAQRESLHCQQFVSLFDLSPFTKIEVSGTGALKFLQTLCCGDIDVETGRVVYTLMLNARAGIEAEITVTRMQTDYFRITSGAASRFKDLFWLRRHLDAGTDTDIDVTIVDVSEEYAVAGIMGPESRDLMRALSTADFSDRSFPFSHSATIEIGGVEMATTRLSFVGELGWELCIPVAQAEQVLEKILVTGEHHNLQLAGHFALDSCRLEKGFHHWGHDMGPEDTPFETGLEFALKMDKSVDFIGRSALLQQQRNGWDKQLRLCEIHADSVLVLHDEPVYRDDQIVGHCTSGGKGFRTRKTLCFVMFYDRNEACDALDIEFEIELAGDRFPLAVLPEPPYPVAIK
jgi:glycine cleavage system aminomethyltransferase T/glycine/D-amino acid oxidase-like deaminating enzyme